MLLKKYHISLNTLPNLFGLWFIGLYQFIVSPLLGNRCRYYPSCSQYSKECFSRFSFFKALWYSVLRIIRCNPFSPGGVDLPPKNKGKKI